ncbi:hypothetical protein [Chryseobacterium sp. MYb328]|uniref:hypothetical protein n=1 Tax=Chryseobacterium sp. MYb328 TaxID=2745231 RepID=UPI00309685A6
MAVFEGSFADFEKFIGPATNKIITKLGRELKKSQKTCQNNALGEYTNNPDYCGRYKCLDTAHFSHKKLDRKSIIRNILNRYFKNGDSYSVNLNTFLNHYEEAHKPLKDNLIMLCRQHHSAYDKKHKVVDEYVLDNEIDNKIQFNDKKITEIDSGKLKERLVNEIRYLKKGNNNISSISGKEKFIWNFNISKNSKKGFFIMFKSV